MSTRSSPPRSPTPSNSSFEVDSDASPKKSASGNLNASRRSHHSSAGSPSSHGSPTKGRPAALSASVVDAARHQPRPAASAHAVVGDPVAQAPPATVHYGYVPNSQIAHLPQHQP